MFSMRIFTGEPRYIRRARTYLQEARMATLEHSIVAEHYRASAQMYAERARRLEEEIGAWEAMKNGTEMMESTREAALAASNLAASMLESSKPAVEKTKTPASVGMVRAA